MINVFKSRTVAVVVVMLALTTLQSAHGLMEEGVYILLESVLAALAVYFRANPKQ